MVEKSTVLEMIISEIAFGNACSGWFFTKLSNKFLKIATRFLLKLVSIQEPCLSSLI